MDKYDFFLLKYRNSLKMGSDVDDYNSNSLNRKNCNYAYNRPVIVEVIVGITGPFLRFVV